MSSLFDPIQIGALKLANRIVMAPLTRMRAFEERSPGPLNATHYVASGAAIASNNHAASLGAK